MPTRGHKGVQMYNPEIWEKVNKENKDLMRDFLSYKQTSGKSPKTIRVYEQALQFFFSWNYKENDNKAFTEIKKREFVRFFSTAINEWDWSPNRVAFVRASLSSLSIFIENILDDEYPLFRNAVLKVEIPVKETVREKTVLSDEDVHKILDGFVAKHLYQQACYVALACFCGARKAELLSFKTCYFDDSNIVYGCLYKTPEKIKTKGRGKNGKQLYKYTLAKEFKPYFDLWMAERKKLGCDCEYLFVKYVDGVWFQTTETNANRWCAQATKILDNGKVFYSHCARHYFATYLMSKGLPSEVVVAIVGWDEKSGMEMLAIYNDNEIENDLGKYFDENGIKENVKAPTVQDIFG